MTELRGREVSNGVIFASELGRFITDTKGFAWSAAGRYLDRVGNSGKNSSDIYHFPFILNRCL
jgi:hypothetical protein